MEHRESFRIDDEVFLSYRNAAEPDETSLSDTLAQQLSNELAALDSQSSPLLASLRQRHNDIAQYLTLQDKRIAILGQLLRAAVLGPNREPNYRVNIGVGGLGFMSETLLEPGSELQLTLVLFPGYRCFQPRARVLHCKPQGDAFRVGMEFLNLSEQERELLTRHLLERQAADLRRQRHND